MSASIEETDKYEKGDDIVHHPDNVTKQVNELQETIAITYDCNKVFKAEIESLKKEKADLKKQVDRCKIILPNMANEI